MQMVSITPVRKMATRLSLGPYGGLTGFVDSAHEVVDEGLVAGVLDPAVEAVEHARLRVRRRCHWGSGGLGHR